MFLYLYFNIYENGYQRCGDMFPVLYGKIVYKYECIDKFKKGVASSKFTACLMQKMYD